MVPLLVTAHRAHVVPSGKRSQHLPLTPESLEMMHMVSFHETRQPRNCHSEEEVCFSGRSAVYSRMWGYPDSKRRAIECGRW